MADEMEKRALRIIEKIGLTVDMTKSQAKKLIKAMNIYCCISCLTEFSSKAKLTRHLKRATKHQVDPSEIKREYKKLYERRHQPEWEQAYLIAFLKVILLVRLQ